MDSITFENVPSFCAALDAVVEVPDVGSVQVDLAYGGAWCAFVDAASLGFAIVPDEARALGELGEKIRPCVQEQLSIVHPLEPDLSYLSFVVFVGAAAGRRRRAARDDRLPRPPGPLPDRDRDLRPRRGALARAGRWARSTSPRA